MSDPSPRITVIIPAYNAERFLARAIESVLAQTVPAHDIPVEHDGSAHSTAAVAERFGGNVRVLRQTNGGPGAARNHGAREAQGDWLAFLDADDCWRPQKLERQLPYIQQGNVDIVFSHVVDPYPGDEPPGEVTFNLLWKHNYVGTSTVVIRRSLFEEDGGFDEDRDVMGIEDYNLWLRLAARNARFVFVAEELVEYTPAPGNLSSNYQKIARSAVRNAEKVAAVVGMEPARLNAKLAEVYEEYGVALLHERNLRGARDCLRKALAYQPNRRNAVRWLSTFAPRTLLDLRRKMSRSKRQFVS